jgi:hypothetical protein
MYPMLDSFPRIEAIGGTNLEQDRLPWLAIRANLQPILGMHYL